MNNHTRPAQTIAKGVVLNAGGEQTVTVNLYLNEEALLLVEGLGEGFRYGGYVYNEELAEIQFLLTDGDALELEDETKIAKTLARDIKLNLGGGADAVVNFHVSEKGFLLVEGLMLEEFVMECYVHDEHLTEFQILMED